MPRELYNEGRVCGMSAYESYIKNALEEDPNTQPVSEREWLASMLAMGSSMLLKIDPFDASKLTDPNNMVFDYKLPSESSLVAPSTITASFFAANPNDFEGIYDDTGWVTQVGSYGDLLKVTSTEPSKGGVYSYNDNSMDDDEKKRMLNYMRIQDGLVLQDGTWETRTASNNPKRILKQPNFKNSPTVRIRFAHEVTTSFFVLLTGFVTFGVVIGESGFGGGAADTANPYNGDFLGPAVFPWANKIMFHTSSAMAYQSQTSIKAGDGTNVEIVADPDSFDTYIKVKNLIESDSTPYLTVWQDDPDGYAGWTVLTLNMDALLDWISSNINMSDLIEAGEGITVTGNGDNGVIISTNIDVGSGLSKEVDSSTGKITIANTMANQSYYNITTGGNNYQVISISGAYPTPEESPLVFSGDSTKDYWILWFNNFFSADNSYSNSGGYPSGGRGTLNVWWAPSYNGDEIVSASIRVGISNAHTLYYNGVLNNSTDTTCFAFGHQYGVTDGAAGETGTRSVVCAIIFPEDGKYAQLSKRGTGYDFAQTMTSNRVWNVYLDGSVFGGSWTVSANLARDTTLSDYYYAYVLQVGSIADGYNTQYYSAPIYKPDSGSELRSGSLNTLCECMIAK